MKNINLKTLLIVLLIILLLFVFAITFGKYNPFAEKESEENKNKKDSLLSRYNKLVTQIEKQKALKIKLDKIFRWVYLSFRVLLVILYCSINYISYKYWGFNSLNDLLNLNEAGIIAVALVLFVIYRDVKSITDALSQIKKYIMYRVYRKYENIDEIIEASVSKKVALANEIKQLEKI